MSNQYGEEYKVFNSNCGFQANIGQNRKKEAWVLNLQMAQNLPGSKNYNWASSIKVQLTESEIVDFMACLLHSKPTLKSIRNNTDESKSFTNTFFTVTTGDKRTSITMNTNATGSRPMIVKLSDPDRFKLSTFAFKCIMKNNGGASQEVLWNIHSKIYTI